MGDPTQMMFIRPRNCTFCGHGYWGLKHVVDYAQQIGAWNITDLEKEQANKEPIYAAIDQTNPGFFYGFGHGSNCVYTADDEQPVFTCDECDKLSGRYCYLLSCLTAQGLGPAIIEKGGIAYAGYDISWTWLSEGDPDGDNDPYEDPYALCFWESGNELWMAILDGMSFYKSIDASITMYNQWIDYWMYDNPEDPYAEECIKWLVHDRNGLVGLPAGKCQYITEEDCLSAGCSWEEGRCLEQQAGVPVFAFVAAIAVIGIAYIAFKK